MIIIPDGRPLTSPAGIDVAGIGPTGELGTSKTVIIPVSGEDRRFIHTFGANAALCAGDLAPAPTRRHAGHDVGAVVEHGTGVKLALAARHALH